ncbi:MAG: carboxypeptidase-like regulatory domain-containing protein [Polaribacter sp.]
MKKTILLFFICCQTFSQKTIFKGKLLDKETNKPVVYANISFLKSNQGISSQEDGTFNLKIDQKILKEKIHISCLNYKDTIVFAKNLQNNTLFLTLKEIELDEIVIAKKIDREFVVDKYRRRHIKSTFRGLDKYPTIISKYFNYNEAYKNTPYLKEVIVYFGAMISRRKSKFRIRFFKVDLKTGNPSEDLIKNEIIAYSSKIDGKIKVDVSKFDIEFPKEGFFIGLERLHIPYNLYEFTYTIEGSKKKHKQINVAPNFGIIQTKDTMKIFHKGKWFDFYYPSIFHKNMSIKPAISLTLSN